MKKISVLGSTGSIGVNTLDVVKDNSSSIKVISLAAGRNISLLKTQIERFKPKLVSVIDEQCAKELKKILNPYAGTSVLFGQDGYREVATVKEAKMVVSAMVGSAGLLPTIDAIDAGKDIALANKESMVMAGNLIVEKAKERGVKILPVDSEHSAVFQCLIGHRHIDVKRIILTASGGPFLHMSKEEIAQVEPIQALKHPTWKMGEKITIDSASMMNKGLEVIEAKWFFNVEIDKIHIYVHPQSVIHSLVEYIDGSIIAQLGVPDMRIPIAYALSYPKRSYRENPCLNLSKAGKLEFIEIDFEKFPNLKLAYNAGRKGGTMPTVLSAANEVVVQAFIDRKIHFFDMTEIIEKVISRHKLKLTPVLEDILAADRWARGEAEKDIEAINN